MTSPARRPVTVDSTKNRGGADHYQTISRIILRNNISFCTNLNIDITPCLLQNPQWVTRARIIDLETSCVQHEGKKRLSPAPAKWYGLGLKFRELSSSDS